MRVVVEAGAAFAVADPALLDAGKAALPEVDRAQRMQALRIANCSGFWGDRMSGAAEMVRGGPIDVLTGDYLAELTMAILAKQRAAGRGGFVGTFLAQMEALLAECMAKKIKIVSNAG